jgi:hypothetical protein
MAKAIDAGKFAEITENFTDLGYLIARMSEPPQSVSLSIEDNQHVAVLWKKCRPHAADYVLPWRRPPKPA